MGLLKKEYPNLFNEIDWDISPSTDYNKLTSGSGIKLFWKCTRSEHTHSYETTVTKRVQGKRCPYCSGNKVLYGYNDFATRNPVLAERWIDETVDPTTVFPYSNKKVSWKCDTGHITQKSITDLTHGSVNCIECKKKLHIPSKTLYSEGLFSELVTPNVSDKLSVYSKEKLLWSCSLGHEYWASPNNRFLGRGCPYCAGSKVLPGFNDVLTTHPEVKDFAVDMKLLSTVSYGSEKKLSWKCSFGHLFDRSVYDYIFKNSSCPKCNNTVLVPGVNDLSLTHPQFISQWADENSISDYTFGSKYVAEWNCDNGHSYNLRINEKTRKDPRGCPLCVSSLGEREIDKFLSNLFDGKVIRHNRSIISPYELDFFLPDKNIAIEYNGLYWHSNANKPNTYHKDKFNRCAEQGIQLITVWEDDWNSKRDIVKSMLARKLGLSTEEKLNARSLGIEVLPKQQVNDFFNAYHIQGSTSFTVALGLIDNQGSIRSVMAFKRRSGNEWELVRYATNSIVRGGFSKLLKRVEVSYSPDKLFSFADVMVSNGGVYEKNGFIFDSNVKPSYWYIVNNRRKHKFGYRVKKFKNDPGLQYKDGLTESQLADLNGLLRVYDAGKIKYIRDYR